MLNLTIHRGTHEIGGTCIELSTQNTRILLDFGMPLADKINNDFKDRNLKDRSIKELIRDKILYPIKGLYKSEDPKFDGILISHSHKDHYGFLKYANPKIPVYISRGAKNLIDVSNIFMPKEQRLEIPDHKIVKHKKSFRIGDFAITPYLVDHSGFDAMSYCIKDEVSGKSVFYSGDFRASGWKNKLFDRFIANPPKEIDHLLIEGTMIDREEGEYLGEQDILDKIVEVLRTTDKNIIFVYCSAQNIDRIVTLYKAVLRANNTMLVIDPYTASVLNAVKTPRNTIPQFDWKKIKVFIANYFGRRGDIYIKKINESVLKNLIPYLGKCKIKPYDLSKIDSKVIMLMRNTMIPPVEQIRGIKGSKLIYSQWKGYIDKDNRESRKFKNFIKRNSLDVEFVHTSGHATIDKLKKLAGAVNPKGKIIPIHTFTPEKFIKHFGKKVLLLKDGERFEF